MIKIDFFFFSSRRRHTRYWRDWSSDVCSSDLGGLGVLAGDTVRAAADLHIPMVAVTLLHRQGYFSQRLDEHGWQHEVPATWAVEDFVHDMPARVEVKVEGRPVHL